MKQLLKRLIQPTPFYSLHLRRQHRLQRNAAIAKWIALGRPLPPPHAVKQQAILAYAYQYGLRTLVETGTFYGDMVEATKRHLDRVVSIEISPDLHQKAIQRFHSDRNVELLQGDSSNVIESVLRGLRAPALFWLDGHYSAGETARGEQDTPIYKELEHVLQSPFQHIVLIDDARCFDPTSPHRDPNYPSLEEVFRFAHSLKGRSFIGVLDDIIRITPL